MVGSPLLSQSRTLQFVPFTIACRSHCVNLLCPVEIKNHLGRVCELRQLLQLLGRLTADAPEVGRHGKQVLDLAAGDQLKGKFQRLRAIQYKSLVLAVQQFYR